MEGPPVLPGPRCLSSPTRRLADAAYVTRATSYDFADPLWHADTVSHELADLGWGARELILPHRDDKPRGPISVPSKQGLSSRGQLLAVLLGLDALPADEAHDVAAALWERDGSGPPWLDGEATSLLT